MYPHLRNQEASPASLLGKVLRDRCPCRMPVCKKCYPQTSHCEGCEERSVSLWQSQGSAEKNQLPGERIATSSALGPPPRNDKGRTAAQTINTVIARLRQKPWQSVPLCRQCYPDTQKQARGAGGDQRGGRMSLREQSLSASPLGRFLAYFFWTSKRSRPPEGAGTYSPSSKS